MALLLFGYSRLVTNREIIRVPLGLSCLHCGQHFNAEDRGVVMPWSTDEGEASCAYHLGCLLITLDLEQPFA